VLGKLPCGYLKHSVPPESCVICHSGRLLENKISIDIRILNNITGMAKIGVQLRKKGV
jgi:hypothetical protein